MKEKNIDNFESNSYFLQKIHSDFFRQILNQTVLKKDKVENIVKIIMQKVFQDKVSKKECKNQAKEYFKEKTEDLIDFLYDIGDIEDKEEKNNSNKYNYNKPKKIFSQIVNPNINKPKIIGRADKILQKKTHRTSRSKSNENVINYNKKYNENKHDHSNHFTKNKQGKNSNSSSSSYKFTNVQSKQEKQLIKPYISLDKVLKPKIALKKEIIIDKEKKLQNDNNKSNKEEDTEVTNENTSIKGDDKKIIIQINNNTFNVTKNQCKIESIKIENNTQNSIINKKEIINEEKNNKKKEVQNNGVKYNIKCKKWPYCKNKNCEYIHPDKPCPFFPKCLYGDRCIYIHPHIPCKFGIYCTRINCAYSHPGFNYPTIW